jgi:RNA polymerase sigma-70 factor (ECF subfamily)
MRCRVATSTLPEVDAWRHDVGRVVQATLDRLPEHYAAILEWKYVDELSVNDIAGRLAVGPKAAESMLTRARVAFRTAIGTGVAGRGRAGSASAASDGSLSA